MRFTAIGLQDRLAKTTDEARAEAVAKRHARGGRTARENLADLTDGGRRSQSTVSWRWRQRTRRPHEGDALRRMPSDEARAPSGGLPSGLARGGRTARENLADLTDGAVSEYGQLAVAAQRTRTRGRCAVCRDGRGCRDHGGR